MGKNEYRMTEQMLQKNRDMDTYPVEDIIRLMNEEDKTVAVSVEKSLPEIERMIEKVVEVLQKGGKLFYIGAGTSGRLGVLDASECPPTFGVAPDLVTGLIAGGDKAIRWAVEDSEDDREAGGYDVTQKVTSEDAVIGIAASGTTPYVLAGIEAANELGAMTGGISCNERTPLSQIAQYSVEVKSGPEMLAGSTRLKAGTAQKMVLNMISTATMIKLGKVYGNLMVNMQATNHKLRERAVNIVREAAGATDEKARETIDRAAGDTQVAILMIKYGIDPEKAFDALKRSNGHFRDAMEIIENSQLDK